VNTSPGGFLTPKLIVYRLTLAGESMRKVSTKRAGLDGKATA